MDQPSKNSSPREIASEVHTINLNFLFIVLVGLGVLSYYLTFILRPLFIAIFLYFFIRALSDSFFPSFIPPLLSETLVIVSVSFSFVLLGFFLYGYLASFKASLPHYEAQIFHLLNRLIEILGFHKLETASPSLGQLLPQSLPQFVDSVFGNLYHFIRTALLTFSFLLFILWEARRLPSRIDKAFSPSRSEEIKKAGARLEGEIKTYLLVKSAVNLGAALTAAPILYFFGVSYWILWAILTFFFNFIPYVGSLIISAIPVLLLFAETSQIWPPLGLTGALFLVHAFWDNYIFPWFSGKKLNFSPLLLLIFISYWGWAWGMVGMILSVPLALCLRLGLEEFKVTRPLALMMTDREE